MWAVRWGEPDFSSAETKMNYRDHGYTISSRGKQLLNWFYFPLQKADEHPRGCAVRFPNPKEPVSAATRPPAPPGDGKPDPIMS
jgi:hypothetical protein